MKSETHAGEVTRNELTMFWVLLIGLNLIWGAALVYFGYYLGVNS